MWQKLFIKRSHSRANKARRAQELWAFHITQCVHCGYWSYRCEKFMGANTGESIKGCPWHGLSIYKHFTRMTACSQFKTYKWNQRAMMWEEVPR